MRPIAATPPNVFLQSTATRLLAAALVLAAGAAAAQPAKVGISKTPLVSGLASAVKPNLMFVLDDSTSMSFEFMSGSGDEPEWGPDRVGRYAQACNSIFYRPLPPTTDPSNPPALGYPRPVEASPSRTSLPAVTFGQAPIDGFDRLSTTNPSAYEQPAIGATFVPNTTAASTSLASAIQQNRTRNLGSSFTILVDRNQIAGDKWWNFPSAFFFVPKPGVTIDPRIDCHVPLGTAAAGAGKWQLVMAASLDAHNQQNFANWYSFYRSRLNAMKSAAGRAFASVDDAVRIGFLTINPTSTTGSVRSDKYLRIDAFDARQRERWIELLYDQRAEPGKQTPLHEALARVGRHYAGLDDRINRGMIVAPDDDPVQYSCQRNYTLLTTDGFPSNSDALTPTNQLIYEADDGTPCAAGGAGCASGMVARPFNDELKGEIRRLLVEGNQRDIHWNHATQRPASSECDYLNGRATNPHTGEALPTVFDNGYGPVTVVGWVPIYRDANSTYFTRLRPHGYGFEVNGWAEPGPGAIGSGPDPELDVYKVTNNLTKGCRPYGFVTYATPEGQRTDVTVNFNRTGTTTKVEDQGWRPWSEQAQGTLADVAMYYYETDLRPSTASGGFRSTNRRGDDVSADNLPGNDPNWRWLEDDKAPHQHMSTFTLGFGVFGNLDYSRDYATAATGHFADLRAGNKIWFPLYTSYTIYLPLDQALLRDLVAKGWPVEPQRNPNGTIVTDASGRPVYMGEIRGDPKIASQSRIDDLWHAAVNGRGLYMSAANAEDVVESVGEALGRIGERGGAGAAAGSGTLEPTAANNSIYTTSYSVPAWTGDVVRRTIETDRTSPNYAQVSGVVASAADQLKLRVGRDCDDRRIFYLPPTSAGGLDATPPTFTFKSRQCASAAETTALPADALARLRAWNIAEFKARKPAAANDDVLADLVGFLRGHSGLEDDDKRKPERERLFRKRGSPLGDLVGSQPVYVKEPPFSYGDSGYMAFKADRSGRGSDPSLARRGTVYVGSNGGMLHAFDATTMRERWAAVPHMVLDRLPVRGSRSYAVRRDYAVDGTPVIGDVFDGTAWRTILVAGLNEGGAGYFALDVTDEENPKHLWTFTNDDLPAGRKHLGKSFGNPVITKHATSGRWVTIVSSGYNNDSGRAVLYVLDAVRGPTAAIVDIDTGEDPGAAEIGLAKIANWVDQTLFDNRTRYVYGGDLKGGVWRFDIVAATAVKIARLTATPASGAPQVVPITTAPELARRRNPSAYMVIVASGKLLDVGDLAIPSDPAQRIKQAVYAIADDVSVANPVTKSTSDLAACAIAETTTGGTTTRASSCTNGAPDPDGWTMALASDGERITVSPRIQLGTLAFLSSAPSTDVCEGGGKTFLNYVDFATGGAVVGAPNAITGESLAGGVGVGFVLVRMESGELRGVITADPGARASPGAAPPPISARVYANTGLPDGRRVSWREIAP